jgi:hypothetical protein
MRTGLCGCWAGGFRLASVSRAAAGVCLLLASRDDVFGAIRGASTAHLQSVRYN